MYTNGGATPTCTPAVGIPRAIPRASSTACALVVFIFQLPATNGIRVMHGSDVWTALRKQSVQLLTGRIGDGGGAGRGSGGEPLTAMLTSNLLLQSFVQIQLRCD